MKKVLVPLVLRMLVIVNSKLGKKCLDGEHHEEMTMKNSPKSITSNMNNFCNASSSRMMHHGR